MACISILKASKNNAEKNPIHLCLILQIPNIFNHTTFLQATSHFTAESFRTLKLANIVQLFLIDKKNQGFENWQGLSS